MERRHVSIHAWRPPIRLVIAIQRFPRRRQSVTSSKRLRQPLCISKLSSERIRPAHLKRAEEERTPDHESAGLPSEAPRLPLAELE
jgi:hypothetical protein